MKKIIRTALIAAALGAVAAPLSSAQAWWGPGYGGGPWNGMGDGWGDM
ncbi:MAG: sulfur globule protein, partial [Moorella sp. (in: Bacteria)]|nr:sulfur globule protein [Moorella sp. (in: firmicutes)]